MSSIPRLISSFTKKEIDHAFKTARSRKKIMGLEILLAPKSFDYGKILVIASRKSGNSPERNLIKRRLKSIFYEEKLYILPYNCIVIVKPGSIDLPFDQLKQILLNNIYSEYIL